MENYKRVTIRRINKGLLEKFPYKYKIKEDKGKYVIVEFTAFKEITYEKFINQIIREKYSIDQEFAILRQRDSKPKEFAEYNTYVEECKAKAKEFVNLRESNKIK